MTWFRIDDRFHASPKVIALFDGVCPGDALALWALGGSWCAAGLTDGHVSLGAVRRLGFGRAAAEELVRVGLWEHAPGGFRFHDWLEYNPSRESVEAQRAAASERMRKRRSRTVPANGSRSSGERAAGSVDVHANTEDVRANIGDRSSNGLRPLSAPAVVEAGSTTVHANTTDVRANIDPCSPTPTRPDPIPISSGSGSRARAREAPEPPPDSEAAAAAADEMARSSRLAMRAAVEAAGGIYLRDDRAEHVEAGRGAAAWATSAGRDVDEVLSEWAGDWVSQADRRSARSWARYVADRVAGRAWGTPAKAGRLPPGTGAGFAEAPDDPDELARIFAPDRRASHG